MDDTRPLSDGERTESAEIATLVLKHVEALGARLYSALPDRETGVAGFTMWTGSGQMFRLRIEEIPSLVSEQR